jgi:hypothetical protein
MSNQSDTSSTGIRLGIFYYLIEKELMIRFQTSEQALAYHAKNPEGRILADKGKCDVWLPVSSKMTCLRSSSLGMIIVFESKDDAKAWRQRSVLGHEIEGEAGVCIPREWSHKELQKLLHDSSTNLKPPGPMKDSIPRNAASKEKAAFQVKESPCSRMPIR